MSATTTETVPGRESWWSRYRAWYGNLPTGVQMIGLQLWLPFVFVIAFCLCYIYAFHAPAPHHIPVAVIGAGPATDHFAQQLQASSNGSLSVSVVPSLAAAQHDVQSGHLAAAFLPGVPNAQLLVASGAQFQLASAAKGIFGPVAAAQGATLHTVDLASLPAHDAYGTALFYLTLVWTIAGYMTAMFVGMMGAALPHRTRLAIIAASSVVLSLIAALLVRFAVGAVDAPFWELWGIGAFTALAVGLVVNGLAYFFGRFVTAVALLVFVFANVPSSGGAFPPEFIPQPFQSLHAVVSGTGTLDLLRSVVYDVGPGAGSGALVLGCYLAAGVLLSVVGRSYFTWRTNRRTRRGAKPSMMLSAQMTAMQALAATPGAAATADPRAAEAQEADSAAGGSVPG